MIVTSEGDLCVLCVPRAIFPDPQLRSASERCCVEPAGQEAARMVLPSLCHLAAFLGVALLPTGQAPPSIQALGLLLVIPLFPFPSPAWELWVLPCKY